MRIDEAVTWRQGAALPKDRPRRLEDLCRQARDRAGTAVVFVDGDRGWSWDDLLGQSAALARAWRGRVRPGDRIAIVLPNGAAHLLVELAAWRLGAVAAPLAIGLTASQRQALIASLEPALQVGTDGLDAAAVLALSASGGDAGEAWIGGADDPCLILWTSGSGGRPRGVVLSQDNLCSQQAAYARLWPEVGPGDRLAGYLPWHHSFGALAERLWILSRGACFHVIPGQGRDHQAFLDALRQVRPTLFCSVPKLHGVAVAAGLPPAGLRWAFTAGAPLAPNLAAAYGDRGIPVVEGWGLTETGPSATITPPGRPWSPGIVGDPIPGAEVGVTAGGRILVGGPGVMLGYWRDETATAACIGMVDGRRCIDSGDLGAWTGSGLRLHGREDHQAKLANGEKVDLAAWELRLADLPGCRHAVVGADADLIALIEADPAVDDAELGRSLGRLNAAETVPWRRIRRLLRLGRALRCEDGDLTASHKVVRPAVWARYRAWTITGGPAFREIPIA